MREFGGLPHQALRAALFPSQSETTLHVTHFVYSARQHEESPGMAELRDEIAAYDEMRADLEAGSLGKWALVHNRALIGTYDTFEAAAEDAVQRFGRGPYLIRQIGAPPISLPASVLYHPIHG